MKFCEFSSILSFPKNLFFAKIIDISKFHMLDLVLLSIDQEMAFDRIDHCYLFKTRKGFGELS